MTTVSDSKPRHAERAPVRETAAAAAGSAVEPAPRRADLRAVDPDVFLAEVFADYSGSGAAVWPYALRRPVLVLRTLQAIRRLPPLSIELPQGRETDAVATALLEYPLSRRSMLGVTSALRTPEVPGTFTDGSSRGTLRRKMRAAAKLGVTVRPIERADRPALLELARLHETQNEREEYRNASPEIDDLTDYDLWLAAYDVDGSPVALTVIPCAGEWGVLRYFRTLVAGQASSDARYLMTEVLAEELGRRGVKYLIDSARPHWLPNGLRHFQRMVGFRLVRVRSIRIARG